MIIAYEKLTKSYRNIVKKNLFHIGEGFILDNKNNILHKFSNINQINIKLLENLNMNKNEIVFIYPCDLKEKDRTLEVCIESYIIRNENFEHICSCINSCSCTKKAIKAFYDLDLRNIKYLL